MTKVVYNGDYGGFTLPDEFIKQYEKDTGVKLWRHFDDQVSRHDPRLVTYVENYKTDLEIRDIGDAKRYYIHNYDGSETVYLEDELEWVHI